MKKSVAQANDRACSITKPCRRAVEERGLLVRETEASTHSQEGPGSRGSQESGTREELGGRVGGKNRRALSKGSREQLIDWHLLGN